MTGNAVRTLVTAALISAVQWAVVTWWPNPTVLAIALIVPALFAGAALTLHVDCTPAAV